MQEVWLLKMHEGGTRGGVCMHLTLDGSVIVFPEWRGHKRNHIYLKTYLGCEASKKTLACFG
jgi:hypothetical protein